MNLNGGGRERFLPREGRLQAVVSSAPQVGRGLSLGDVGGEVIVALRTNFEDSPRLDTGDPWEAGHRGQVWQAQDEVVSGILSPHPWPPPFGRNDDSTSLPIF